MDNNKCYLCEKLCYNESQPYIDCVYRKQKSFGVRENREYEIACTRLALKFARKHGLRFEGWVGHFDPTKHTWYEGAGGHSMDDMRTDIMMDAHPDAIRQYLDDYLDEAYAAEQDGREPRMVNYRNWLLGARFNPGESSEEYLLMRNRELDEERKRLEETRERLLAQLKEQAQRDADDLLAGSDGLY